MTFGRIYQNPTAISSNSVKEFYEKRAKNAQGWNAVLLKDERQSKEDVDLRNVHEAELLKTAIADKQDLRILDVGCGNGRWLSNLLISGVPIGHYDGIDFVASFLEKLQAEYQNMPHIHFHEMNVCHLNAQVLQKEYDLIITCGLFMYINDEEIPSIFKTLGAHLAKGGIFYSEESVATMGKRLTLKDFYSQELKCPYNAIYRTPEEYAHWLVDEVGGQLLPGSGKMLLTKDTGAWDETNQCCWLLKKI